MTIELLATIDLQKQQLDKYKNVIDKIKEYTKITSKLKYENEYVGLFVKDICNDILELLEEVE